MGNLDTHNYDAMKLPAMHTSSGREARFLLTAKLVPCAKSLVMGDLSAVDFATAAHEHVLIEADAIHTDLSSTWQTLSARPVSPLLGDRQSYRFCCWAGFWLRSSH